MKLPRYSKYKPSGVEWLGEVPVGWEIKRLKYVSSINDDILTETTREDYELEYIDIGSVDRIAGITSTEQFLFENAPSRARRKVKNGDTIVSTVRTYLKAVATINNPPENLIVSTGFAVVRPRHLVPGFTAACLTSSYFIETVVSRSVGVSYPATNASDLGDIFLPVPPLSEQTAIAAFLDSATAKLDALMEKKRTLIEKLKEKRSALISRAVTKGLNPKAKMKASGVEWLGEVPEGWEIAPLKRAIRFKEGPGIMAIDFMDEGVPLLRISGIGQRKASLFGCDFLSPQLVARRWAHFRVEVGDLLISGSASTGMCSEIDEETSGAVPYTGIIIIRPIWGKSIKEFLRWFFLSEGFKIQSDLAKTGTTIQHFGPSHLSKMVIALPTHVEQIAIADYLDRETVKIDRMIEKVEEAIDKLSEYRTALITAAVTGKIDVRGVKK